MRIPRARRQSDRSDTRVYACKCRQVSHTSRVSASDCDWVSGIMRIARSRLDLRTGRPAVARARWTMPAHAQTICAWKHDKEGAAKLQSGGLKASRRPQSFDGSLAPLSLLACGYTLGGREAAANSSERCRCFVKLPTRQRATRVRARAHLTKQVGQHAQLAHRAACCGAGVHTWRCGLLGE